LARATGKAKALMADIAITVDLSGLPKTVSGLSQIQAKSTEAAKAINSIAAPADKVGSSVNAVTNNVLKLGAAGAAVAVVAGTFDDISDAAEDVAKSTEKASSAAGTMINTFTKFAAAAAVVGVVASYFDEVDSALTNVVKSSRALGASAEQMERWTYAASTAGISADSFINSLQSLNVRMGEALLNRASDSGKAFAYLGVSLKDAAGKARTVSDALPDIIDSLSQITDKAMQNRIAYQLLGAEGAALADQFAGGSVEFLAAGRALTTVADVLGNEAYDAFKDANGVVKDFHDTIAVFATIGYAALIQGATDVIMRLGKEYEALTDVVYSFTEGSIDLAKSIQENFGIYETWIDLLARLQKEAQSVQGAVTDFAISVSATIADIDQETGLFTRIGKELGFVGEQARGAAEAFGLLAKPAPSLPAIAPPKIPQTTDIAEGSAKPRFARRNLFDTEAINNSRVVAEKAAKQLAEDWAAAFSAAQRHEAEEIANRNAMFREGLALYEAAKGPQERILDQLKRAEELYKSGALEIDQYGKVVASLEKSYEQADSAAKSFADTITGGIGDMITGTEDFGDQIDNIGKKLLKNFADKAVLDPLNSALTSLVSGGAPSTDGKASGQGLLEGMLTTFETGAQRFGDTFATNLPVMSGLFDNLLGGMGNVFNGLLNGLGAR
jgi:hypothetical protein